MSDGAELEHRSNEGPGGVCPAPAARENAACESAANGSVRHDVATCKWPAVRPGIIEAKTSAAATAGHRPQRAPRQ